MSNSETGMFVAHAMHLQDHLQRQSWFLLYR